MRRRDESGMTLVEMLVTMSLLAVVGVMFLSIMASVQRGVAAESDRSNDNDQARLAVQQLDREVRSGNVLYDPEFEGTVPCGGVSPCYSLRVYTQNNANIRNPGNRCVQWRVLGEELQRRDWATGNPAGTVTSWRVVAENIVNATLGIPPFDLITSAEDQSKGGRIVNVEILTQTDDDSGQPVRIRAAISGRNTSYGYPIDVCATVPPI